MTSSSPPPEGQPPHPEALARTFIAHGDMQSALAVCACWRRREPDDQRVDEVEEEARSAPRSTASPPILDQKLAERYVQDGYLEEALLIYQRLAFFSDIDRDTSERINLLGNFLAFSPPDSAPDQVLKAEEQLAQRRLAVALLIYHEIASQHPELEYAERRRDQLKELVSDDPYASSREVSELGDTIAVDSQKDEDESTESGGPRPRKRRFGARTQRDLDIPSNVRNAATEKEAKEWEESEEFVDPLDDTQQIDRNDVPGLTMPKVEQARRQDEEALVNALSSTILAPTPLDTPFSTTPVEEDDDDLPDDKTAEIEPERLSQGFGDPTVDDRATTQEQPDASGVIVRQIRIIEG